MANITKAERERRAVLAEQSPEAAQPALIKMYRDGKTADVHPLEVQNYRSGGWQLTEN